MVYSLNDLSEDLGRTISILNIVQIVCSGFSLLGNVVMFVGFWFWFIDDCICANKISLIGALVSLVAGIVRFGLERYHNYSEEKAISATLTHIKYVLEENKRTNFDCRVFEDSYDSISAMFLKSVNPFFICSECKLRPTCDSCPSCDCQENHLQCETCEHCINVRRCNKPQNRRQFLRSTTLWKKCGKLNWLLSQLYQCCKFLEKALLTVLPGYLVISNSKDLMNVIVSLKNNSTKDSWATLSNFHKLTEGSELVLSIVGIILGIYSCVKYARRQWKGKTEIKSWNLVPLMIQQISKADETANRTADRDNHSGDTSYPGEGLNLSRVEIQEDRFQNQERNADEKHYQNCDGTELSGYQIPRQQARIELQERTTAKAPNDTGPENESSSEWTLQEEQPSISSDRVRSGEPIYENI